jgi:hypothetical protein
MKALMALIKSLKFGADFFFLLINFFDNIFPYMSKIPNLTNPFVEVTISKHCD